MLQTPSLQNATRSHKGRLELSLVVVIVAVLCILTFMLIDPQDKIGELHNDQRYEDIRSIFEAVEQYSIDHYGSLPSDAIPVGNVCSSDGMEICALGVDCGGAVLDILVGEDAYLAALPNDPTESTDTSSGYYIFQNIEGRIGVCAPSAYNDVDISVTR
jgi:hypothetical protein